MSFESVRGKANRLRSVPLPLVVSTFGAEPDSRDKSKWHTDRGIISINGSKFFNWTSDRGGGGAIDLAMHLLGDCAFSPALDWLEDHFPDQHQLQAPEPQPHHLPEQKLHQPQSTLQLPGPDPLQLGCVRSYLINERGIAPELIDRLIESGILYADARANAVFLLFDSETHTTAVGAELRGTRSTSWRGMTSGSRKDHGYFSTFGVDTANREIHSERHSRTIILCESAIDALSCYSIFPGISCISTSGVRSNPAWLAGLLKKGHTIYCGFDADEPGDTMARSMIAAQPDIRRLRPARHDWNDLLKILQ